MPKQNNELSPKANASNKTITSNTLFYSGTDVTSSRVLYTPSQFAKTSLLWLQEVGKLTVLRPHVSGRDHLSSCLFFVVREGEGWLEYRGERYELKAEDCVFIDCKYGYAQSSSEKAWALSWVHWNGHSMPAIYNKYCERGGKPVFKQSNATPFIKLLDDLYTIASTESYIRDVEINSLLNELIGLLFAKTVYEENGDTTDWDKPAVMNIGAEKIDVGEIKSYIDTHYKEQLSLEGLADHFHFNKNYVSRVFKETFGMSVGGYIALVRIGKSKELLRFTSLTAEQISYECGYGGDSNYFSRVFKKVEGVPPSEYRRNWRSSKDSVDDSRVK